VSLPGAAVSADLGSSSKYSNETLEDWREKGIREQPLHTSQSILSPRRNLMSMTAYNILECRNM